MPAYSTEKGFTGNKDKIGKSIAGNNANGGGATTQGGAATKALAQNAQKKTYDRYRDPDVGGQVTSYGAPVHTNMDGPGKGVQTAQNEKSWANTKTVTKEYNDARREYEKRPFGNQLLDFLAGPFYDEQPPDITDPNTYWGGTYHSSTNVVGAALSLLGGLGGPLGVVAGKGAGVAAQASGVGDVYHNEMPSSDALAAARNRVAKAMGSSVSSGGDSTADRGNAARGSERTENVGSTLVGTPLRAQARQLTDSSGDSSGDGSSTAPEFSDVMLKDRRKPYSGLKQMLETML
jgi:hypothetical protein